MSNNEVIKSDEMFVNILSLIVGSFLLINIYSLLMGSYIMLIAITLHSSILISIFKKHRSQIILIKIWSAIVFVSGAFGFISILLKLFVNTIKDEVALNEGLTIYAILYNTFTVGIGYYFYSEAANKINIESLPNVEQQSQTAG